MNTLDASGRKWNERCNPISDLGADDSTFRVLFERSMDPIWIFDPETNRFVDCNQAAADLMRCTTKDELLQKPPAEFAPPNQPGGRPSGEYAAEITAQVEREGGLRFQWLGRRLDGTEVPLEVVSTQIRMGGRSLHVIVSRDITERKEAEAEIRRLNESLERRIAERTAELQESEARALMLVEHAPEAIVVFDGDTGRFVSGNENATRLYGLSREALVSLTPAEVSPKYQPDGRPSAVAARERIEQALRGENPVFEWFHRHASGRFIPCEVRLLRLPAEGRNLVRASIIDNTWRRRRERIQQATYQISEAVHTAGDLKSLYEQIHYIIMGLMPAQNFYIALYDPATELITFEYHIDEISEQPSPRPVGTGLTGWVLRTGKPLLVGREMNARKKRVGNAVTFEGLDNVSYVEAGKPAAIWLGVPLSIQGRPIGVMAVQDYHDDQAYGEEEKKILSFVAMQTALAIERKRSLDRERELSALKSSFVSLVSHEFRTPLGIIMSSAEILDDYLDQLDPEERKGHLQSIQKNCRRMADLMEDVLLLARFDADKVEFKPARVDLPALCRRVVDEVLSATNRQSPIELRLGSMPAEARADERLLEHIFTNLLQNAVKYSRPGSPVEFDVAQSGPDAVCVVRDHGIGIPEQDREWLFHPFHRGRNVGERAGTGLGLVVVHRCVQRHRGSIQVESRVGEGTTMTVRLPLFGQPPEDRRET